MAAQAYLAAATVRLNTLTAKLERIAEWKEDLAQRLWRAQLLFELVRLDPDEEDRLADEVHAFTALCLALADSLGDSSHEREGAGA